MQRRILLGGLTAALLPGLARPQAPDARVLIDNFAFSPATLTVKAGTRVVWTNGDDIPHTVTDAATPRSFRSPVLDTGDRFAMAFPTPGTTHYFCSLHPHMQGSVVVQ